MGMTKSPLVLVLVLSLAVGRRVVVDGRFRVRFRFRVGFRFRVTPRVRIRIRFRIRVRMALSLEGGLLPSSRAACPPADAPFCMFRRRRRRLLFKCCSVSVWQQVSGRHERRRLK